MSVDSIHHRVELPPEMASARTARRAVESDLRDDGFVGDVAGIMLLVSELVTNAVMHGEPPHAVVIDVTDDVVHVSVEDGDVSRTPEVAPAGTAVSTVGGHGLRLVEELADEWGWDIRADAGGHACGKSVWFTVGPRG